MPLDPRLRVLHADDDECFRMLFLRAIGSMPDVGVRCIVRSVADGTDAADYILGRGAYADRAAHPVPDLVILDERMRRMDGAEVLRAIRADPATHQSVVCILSTSSQPGRLRALEDTGGAFCIEKPLDFSRFGAKLRLLLEFCLDVLELPRHRAARAAPVRAEARASCPGAGQ